METEYHVTEIYPMVQGEGWNTGLPGTIVRMAGCNVNCQFCLGPKTKISTIYGRVSIEDVQEGDVVIGWDGKSLAPTTVVKKMSHQADSVLRIKLKRSERPVIYATVEHPFYVVKRGWVDAGDLKVGDVFWSAKPNEIISIQKKLNNPMRRPEVAARKVANIDYEAMGKKVAVTLRERGIHPPPMTEQQRAKVSERMKANNPMHDPVIAAKVSATLKAMGHAGPLGDLWQDPAFRAAQVQRMRENNPMFDPEVVKRNAEGHKKYGMSGPERRLMEILEQHGLPVRYVGDYTLPIGDEVHGYRFPDFQVLGMHKVLESYSPTYRYSSGFRGQEYEQELRAHYERFGWEVAFIARDRITNAQVTEVVQEVTDFIHNGVEVESIDELSGPALMRGRRIDKVYNLECSPHHNYLAHGVLTHNCDTPDSLTRQHARVATTEQLMERILSLHRAGQIILFTGGEPLLQPIHLVVERLMVLGIGPVHLETNGTICAPNVFNWITVSPKKAARYDVHIWTITLANEVKWLVRDEGDVERLKQFLADWEDQFKGVVSIQPISCDPRATDIAYAAAIEEGWRLSLQTHKLIGKR